MSYPPTLDYDYDYGTSAPLSATSSSSSSTTSTSSTLISSMNDATNLSNGGDLMGAKMMNGANFGFNPMMNQQQFAGMPQQQQQQFPPQFAQQQALQGGGFRQPFPTQQAQAFAQQQQQQFAPLSHPGAMPNMNTMRPQPNQPMPPRQGQPNTLADLQQMQAKAINQRYSAMQAGVLPQGITPNATGNANAGPQQNLTPYQHQQAMLQLQQQREKGGVNAQAQQFAQQNAIGGQQQFQQPLAPQHSGQQPQQLMPQHSGHQGMTNGFGGGAAGQMQANGVNPAMLAQQAQFKQPGNMLNGAGIAQQIGRPGTAMGGINPALMFGNNAGAQNPAAMQQMLQQQQQLRQQQQFGMPPPQLQQQHSDGMPQQPPAVPASPALSAASQSRQPSIMPPPSITPMHGQRQPHQPDGIERSMSQTPAPATMSPSASTHATPATNSQALPGGEAMSRPMSRMSSSGAPGAPGWNGGQPQVQQNGFGGVDPRALNRPPQQQVAPGQMPQQAQQQQQHVVGISQQQRFGAGGNLQNHQFNGQFQQPQMPQQANQMMPGMGFPNAMAPPLQQRQSQDQLSQQALVQGTPRMAASMPPPVTIPQQAHVGLGMNSAGGMSMAGSTPTSNRADSHPPPTPTNPVANMNGITGGPLTNAPGNVMEMARLQHGLKMQQAGIPNQQLPTPQEVMAALNPQMQAQLKSLPPQQQQQQMMMLQMRLMQQQQANRQQQAQLQAAQGQQVAPPGIVGAGRPIPPGLLPGVNVPPQHGGPQPPVPAGPQLPPHLVGKVDPRMLIIRPLPFVSDEDDVTHGGQLPELSEREMYKIKHWLQKDKEYIEVVEKSDHERKLRNNKELADAVGRPRWFEMDGPHPGPAPGQKVAVLWPAEKRKQRKAKIGRAETRYPLEYPVEVSSVAEELVPIRLEIEHETYRFRDTLVWNLNDPVATVEQFAAITCEDFQLPSAMASLITRQIQEQLTDYKAAELQKHVPDSEAPEIIQGSIGDSEDTFWEGWRKRLRTDTEGTFVVRGRSDDESGELKRKLVAKDDAEFEKLKIVDVKNLPPPPSDVKQAAEIRIMIKLDIIIGSKQLIDQFEWDITEQTNSPELFAETYAKELGLGGEFKTAICHDIREQVNMYQRALVSVGHNFDGGTIFDDDLRQAILPPVSIAGRTAEQAAQCMPIFNKLSDNEIENNEKEREKELRRKKKQSRVRRGALFAEREPLKTHRTLPGCADVGSLIPPPAAVTVPSRRQAAVNASQTIASLVAQENNNGFTPVVHTPTRDSSFLAPPNANGPQTRSSKRQKVGHLNPPPLPETIYRPRSQMAANYAPPSTGVKPPPKSIERIQADNEARENERAQLPEWHCSTCGCPDSIAVGRRKGPKGDKSQCGPCGKFYHRYRRTKDVVYNPDPEYHMRIRQTEIERKKRRRGPAKSRKSALGDLGNDMTADTNSPAPGGDDDDDDDDDDDGPPLSQARATTPPPRAKSPPPSRQRVRSPSSSPSPPLATARPVEARPPPRDPTPPPVQPPAAAAAAAPSTPAPPPAAAHHHHVPSFNPDTPGWMLNCLQELQSRYVNDRFIAIIRPPQPTAPPGAPKEWRIKCLDCPGKVYTPGPEETLSNFEVHLRNKKHRDNVNQRLGTAPTHGAPGAAAP